MYDGTAKRVRASVQPNFPLLYSYYPNPDLREAAQKAAREAAGAENAVTQAFRGYRRVDRPPTETGTYYVWIYYPGDENYMSASTDVEFIVTPRD